MNPYRCQLCGETYLGSYEPDRCPFCGASGIILLPPALWVDYGEVEMSEKSKENCRQSLQLEVNNQAYYRLCAEKSENRINQSIFKRLAKHEGEHAELVADMLGEEEPEPEEPSCPESDSEKFAAAHQRENRAINFYLQSAEEAQQAGEERVAFVFRYLSEVESEHMKLSNLHQ